MKFEFICSNCDYTYLEKQKDFFASLILNAKKNHPGPKKINKKNNSSPLTNKLLLYLITYYFV